MSIPNPTLTEIRHLSAVNSEATQFGVSFQLRRLKLGYCKLNVKPLYTGIPVMMLLLFYFPEAQLSSGG